MSIISSSDEKQTLPLFVVGLMASVNFVGILSELVLSGILPQAYYGGTCKQYCRYRLG